MDAAICPMWTNLFQQNSFYFLPKYQRAYSWQKAQLDDFWNDIQEAIAKSPELPYLLGTLYLAKVDSKSVKREVHRSVWEAYEEHLQTHENFLIIDGQQRITTLFLLRLAIEHNDALAINGMSKLALGQVDFGFLSALVNGEKIEPATRSNKNIAFAHDYFTEKFQDLSDEKKEAFLVFLKRHLQAVYITLTDNLELATTLFVSQTDRGKRLTVLDKLKSSLIFYTQKSSLHGSLGIDDMFGKLYVTIEHLVSLQLYKNSDDLEADVMRILHVLLKKSGFYKSDLLGDLKGKIGWEVGEQRVYDAIAAMLRFSPRDQKEQCLTTLYATMVQIQTFLDYIYHIRMRELEEQYLDPYVQHIWYPSLQLFPLLKPSRFSKALLVELFSGKDHKSVEDARYYFAKMDDETVHSESIVRVQERTAVDVLSREKIDKIYLKLQTLLSQNPSDFHDMVEIQKCEPMASLLRAKLQRTLERVNQFQDYLDNRYISMVNVIEKIELSIWKNGKRPIGSLMEKGMNSDALLKHTLDYAYRYKEQNNYLLRDFGFGNVKYLLLEYERMVHGDTQSYQKIIAMESSEDDNVSIQREHIYPVNLDESVAEEIKQLWSQGGSVVYSDWIWKIGNVTLLEHHINIGNASNKPIDEKARVYLEHQTIFAHTRELATDVLEIASLLDELKLDKKSPLWHYPYKVLLEIRELELLSFLYCRF